MQAYLVVPYTSDRVDLTLYSLNLSAHYSKMNEKDTDGTVIIFLYIYIYSPNMLYQKENIWED